jgi:hypothetical protein
MNTRKHIRQRIGKDVEIFVAAAGNTDELFQSACDGLADENISLKKTL